MLISVSYFKIIEIEDELVSLEFHFFYLFLKNFIKLQLTIQ